MMLKPWLELMPLKKLWFWKISSWKSLVFQRSWSSLKPTQTAKMLCQASTHQSRTTEEAEPRLIQQGWERCWRMEPFTVSSWSQPTFNWLTVWQRKELPRLPSSKLLKMVNSLIKSKLYLLQSSKVFSQKFQISKFYKINKVFKEKKVLKENKKQFLKFIYKLTYEDFKIKLWWCTYLMSNTTTSRKDRVFKVHTFIDKDQAKNPRKKQRMKEIRIRLTDRC